jgi:hypothetical protein
MNVKILLDREPTAHNYKLLSFLMNNVKTYRSGLHMSIVTIQKKHHKTLDKKITTLPAAYIGTNVVMGYQNIIKSIKMAYTQTASNNNEDPVQSFWEKNIQTGIDEVKKRPSEKESIDSRFTEVSKLRKDAYNARAPRFKNKSMPEETPIKENGSNKKNLKRNNAPKTTAEMMMQHSESNGAQSGDYDDPATIETDPHMRMFWANQNITPGT